MRQCCEKEEGGWGGREEERWIYGERGRKKEEEEEEKKTSHRSPVRTPRPFTHRKKNPSSKSAINSSHQLSSRVRGRLASLQSEADRLSARVRQRSGYRTDRSVRPVRACPGAETFRTHHSPGSVTWISSHNYNYIFEGGREGGGDTGFPSALSMAFFLFLSPLRYFVEPDCSKAHADVSVSKLRFPDSAGR